MPAVVLLNVPARSIVVLGRPHYVAEAQQQFLIHIKHLYDRRSGLWFHGWTFRGHHNLAEALWARGSCRVTIGDPRVHRAAESACQ